jgi:hypothetical protein
VQFLVYYFPIDYYYLQAGYELYYDHGQKERAASAPYDDSIVAPIVALVALVESLVSMVEEDTVEDTLEDTVVHRVEHKVEHKVERIVVHMDCIRVGYKVGA